MLSRHRAACVVVGRAGITETLERTGTGNERVLGIDEDAGYRGWKANTSILGHLEADGRILTLDE